MTSEIVIPIITPKALRHLWELHGLTRADVVLGDYKDPRPPGFGLASALVGAELSSARAEFTGEMLKEVARAGHDISKSREIKASFRGNKPVILIEMMDLADDQ